MEMACSMAFRLAISSSSRDTKPFNSLPSPRSSFAVSTCFSCSAGLSRQKVVPIILLDTLDLSVLPGCNDQCHNQESTWSAARSIRKAWSCWLALATMLSKRSVTLTGEVGWLPMAETTTSFCSAGSSATSWATSLMRSAAATHVPPNLWTCGTQAQGFQATMVNFATPLKQAQSVLETGRIQHLRNDAYTTYVSLGESTSR